MAPVSPIKGMDFARKQLLKYGWKEGKGLGRNESGIATAIKPKLKFDTHGIGHDASEQFTFRWWEHAFNKAAGNIQVATTEDGVTVTLEDEDLDITTNKYSKLKLQKDNALEYGSFLKTSTLTGGGKIVRTLEETPESEQKESSPAFESLTDEDLFKICGGCTAHKGARHGLKLNGKLARIEKQEEELLRKRDRVSDENGNVERRRKKKKKVKYDVEEEAQHTHNKKRQHHCDEENESTSPKKKKKKHTENC